MRKEDDYDGRVRTGRRAEGDGENEGLVQRRVVYAQEALRVAQEMRCDRYCECSAWTGEVRLPCFCSTAIKCMHSIAGQKAGSVQTLEG